MTDDKIAYAIAKHEEMRHRRLSATRRQLGIGAMTDARWASFYDAMVDAGVLPEPASIRRKAYTTEFVNKGVGHGLTADGAAASPSRPAMRRHPSGEPRPLLLSVRRASPSASPTARWRCAASTSTIAQRRVRHAARAVGLRQEHVAAA